MAKTKVTVKFKTEVKDGSSVLSYTVKDGMIEVKAKDAHNFYAHPFFTLMPGEPVVEKVPVVAPTVSPEEFEEGDTPDASTLEKEPEEEPEEEEKPRKKKKKKKAAKKKKTDE